MASSSRRWPGRVLAVCAGLVVGVALTEGVFYLRDDGAFPHLNVYQADPVLGVRLEPGGRQRVAFTGNPASDVRINQLGYRGADWPAAAPGEILVVGDSQVFGLGVEEGQAFSARLAAATGKTVLNAGVPTYGPREYTAVVDEVLTARKSTGATVIYTVNMVNDLFEVDRPNKDRHAVWDGWAVRRETAPAAVSEFPGRRFLYRRSHAFFALRKLMYQKAATGDRGFASEGDFTDVVAAGSSEQARHEQAEKDAAARRAERLARLSAAERELAAKGSELDKQLHEAFPDAFDDFDSELPLRAARVEPGDILDDTQFSEAARPISATAAMIRKGTEARAKLIAQKAELKARADEQARLAGEVIRLDGQPLVAQAIESPLLPALKEIQAVCDRHGARLIVVVLPIDVQVSAEEWQKYGQPAVDMSATLVLNQDVIATATALGVSSLDATAALAAARPGAFLKGDIHMTVKGHQALADALVPVLAGKPPAPASATPRSPVPVPEAFRAADFVKIGGAANPDCLAKQVREWLRITCQSPRYNRDVIELEVTSDARGEASSLAIYGFASLLTPVLPGEDVVVDLHAESYRQILRVRWPVGEKAPTISFDKPRDDKGVRKKFGPGHDALLDCARQLASPTTIYGYYEPDCLVRHAKDCTQLLACLRRDPASP